MSNLLSSLLLLTKGKNKTDEEFDKLIEECKHISYLITLDDWTGHEEEYENEVIEHFNHINTDKRDIRKTLDNIREKQEYEPDENKRKIFWG